MVFSSEKFSRFHKICKEGFLVLYNTVLLFVMDSMVYSLLANRDSSFANTPGREPYLKRFTKMLSVAKQGVRTLLTNTLGNVDSYLFGTSKFFCKKS